MLCYLFSASDDNSIKLIESMTEMEGDNEMQSIQMESTSESNDGDAKSSGHSHQGKNNICYFIFHSILLN